MNKPIYNLGDTVRMTFSEEAGQIIGRAEYLHSETQYYIRYQAADGRQVESYWGESAIALP